MKKYTKLLITSNPSPNYPQPADSPALLKKSSKPVGSTGIWYLVREPNQWRLITYRYDDYHGDDWRPFAESSAIESSFGIQGMAKWALDSHEQCQSADKETVRAMLRIKEDWPAVDF